VRDRGELREGEEGELVVDVEIQARVHGEFEHVLELPGSLGGREGEWANARQPIYALLI
jgi:hypothetical protein